MLGICGGFQMLSRRIDDPVESRAGLVEAIGLLDADIAFASDKTLRRWDTPLHGYEIHHGQVERHTEDDWLGVGIRRGRVTAHTGTGCSTTMTSPAMAHRAAAVANPGSSSPTTSTCLRAVMRSSI